VVVGAGLGGLATACHLLGAGWDVRVIERLACLATERLGAAA
jgi:phytoene dehydrogenase-like protein